MEIDLEKVYLGSISRAVHSTQLYSLAEAPQPPPPPAITPHLDSAIGQPR